MNILGISAYYHDSAACLIQDGEIIAAAQEERFTRKKHDPAFPANAASYCLAEGRVSGKDLDAIAFYDKPITKFARLLETYLSVAPRGLRSFLTAMPVWVKEKLWVPLEISSKVEEIIGPGHWKLYMPEHHESHAASAFFPSPFPRAAILTVDGVGEWATSCMGRGEDHGIQILKETRFPHSLGLLYSAFTYFTGFRVNSGEYKLMGLAPYGEPEYVKIIKDELIDIKEDGSFQMNMKYFGYLDGLTMTNEAFANLFGGPARRMEAPITKREADLARSIQVVTEEVLIKMARHTHELTGEKALCLAGGVALNCVANAKILRESPFERLWLQPAAGDAGGALGAALFAWHQILGNARSADGTHDKMKGSLLGPAFSEAQIEAFLKAKGYPYVKLTEEEWPDRIAHLMDQEKVVGLFQGRMEFGPRALGSRSIIGDPRSETMQSTMNLKVKMRESFRPFAPSVLAEKAADVFEMEGESPYMLLVADVRSDRRIAAKGDEEGLTLRDWVNRKRSDVPAITHVDYSARLQTVNREIHPGFHRILAAFDKITGCPVVINTSFNQRGEPVVCTPEDAFNCFMRTGIDVLILGPFLLEKGQQSEEAKLKALESGQFELD